MKIRYVVSSMVFWGREHHLSLEQDCEFLKALGFGIELWPNAGGISECRFERRNWDRLAAATEGMLVSLRTRNDNPTIEQWQEQIQCAKLLKANIVTDLRSLGVPEGQDDINGSDFSHRIVAMADEDDVKLCIETGWLKTLLTLGKRFDSISYCFDSGFANLDKQFSFKEYVDKLGSRITHLHLTDNYGQCDDHAPIGVQGGISRENWDYLLQALNKYDNNVIACLEMQPPFPGVLIRQACEFLFDQLQWPNRPEKLPKISSLSLTTG